MNIQKFKDIIDETYDQIYIFDNDYKLIYANKACFRHYGVNSDELLERNVVDLDSLVYWYPSALPYVYKHKKVISLEQLSNLNEKIIGTSVPILDNNGEVEYVVMSCRDSLNNLYTVDTPEFKDLKMVYAKEVNTLINKHVSIIYESEKMKSIIDKCIKLGKYDVNVLISGETGTGKSQLAKFIHFNSKRKNGKFLPINCAAIPEHLIESELFGYKKGAFTGAVKEGKKGLLEHADGGTLFLDEIGELSINLQAKILQVVQDKQFIPIGGNELIRVDVRIIAATNCDLEDMMRNKTFREDLYWRLNVVHIEVPSLRDRKEDIEPLANYFLNKFNNKYKENKTLGNDVLERLKSHVWEGNIRELENVIEQMVIFSDKSNISCKDIPLSFKRDEEYVNNDNRLNLKLEIEEKKMVEAAYREYRTTRKVAEHLNVSQSKASKLIRKYCKNG